MSNLPELGLFAKIALTSVIALLGIWLSVLIIRWLVRTLRVEADQFETLRLVNQGNSACQYHLSVNTTAPNLKFTLYADGVPLAPVYEEIEEEAIEEQAVVQEESKPVAATPAANTGTQAATKTEKMDTEGALKAGQDASAKVGVLANLLGIIGSILPGKLGAKVKGAAGGARKVQSTSAKAVQAPKSAQRKMDAMKSSGSRLGVKAGDAQGADVVKPKTGARQMRGKQEQTEFSRPTRDVVKTIKRMVEKVGVVQTVDLDPGDVLFLALEISKQGKRYPTGSFGYSIESQPVPLNKRLGEAPPAVKKAQVHFAPIGRWRYWMPSLSVMLYLILLAFAAYYFVLFLWV